MAFASAGKLKTLCLGRGAARATCLGYLTGVTDALRHPRTRQALAREPGGRALCLPPKLKAEQVRLLLLNHLHQHPESLAASGAGEVWRALAASFACAGTPSPDRPAVPRKGERLSMD